MEAVRDFIKDFTACGDETQGTDRGAAPVGQSGLDAALAALRALPRYTTAAIEAAVPRTIGRIHGIQVRPGW